MKLAAILLVLVSAATAQKSRVDPAAEARTAFFVRSDLRDTMALAQAGLKLHPRDPALLFLAMEASALEGDSTTTLDASLRLCSAVGDRSDPRGSIAAARILDLAGNTDSFIAAIPRIRRLINAGSPYSSYLRSALVAAASEGVPGLDILSLAHESGLITDWRIAGPFGTFSNIAFEKSWSPEQDELKQSTTDGKPVERLRFEDGNFTVPDYFDRDGVFFAAANVQVTSNASRILRVESPGTLEIFLDGRSVLRKDNRFRLGPEIVRANLALSAGNHVVLAKFLANATPFRVALLPPPRTQTTTQPTSSDPVENAYIVAARNYLSGNYADAASQLTTLTKLQPSAAADFLLAQTWAQSNENSPEELNPLALALKLSPNAMSVEFRLAELAQQAGRTDEAWSRVSDVIKQRPDFAPAQQLAAMIAASRNWTVEAISAFDESVKLHPTCSSLTDAYKFFFGRSQFARATQLLNRIATCSPTSTAYIERLSDAGEHDKAARAAQTLFDFHSLNRRALYLLVRELALAGKPDEARASARQLADIAPNSPRFQTIANSNGDLVGLLDENTGAAHDLTDPHPFYEPYRRNGLEVARESASKKFSESAVTLLEDKVSQLSDNGSVSVYFHRLVKVLTRSGIETYGEVSLPRNAEILELRTIATDGTISEPEFQEHKVTVSMPALLPGAVIEQEYVIHYSGHGGISAHPNEFGFIFGSGNLPMQSTRFVAITPMSVAVAARELNGAPRGTASTRDNQRIQSWQRDDIPTLPEEGALPAREVFSAVRIAEIPTNGWTDVRDFYRDTVISASQVGPRTLAVVNSLRLLNDEAARLRSIYSFVLTRIRSDHSSSSSGSPTSAEDTLAMNIGNRTATFIALAHAAGLHADLVLARDLSSDSPVISRSAFTRPLAQVTLKNSSVTLDVESDYMGLGLISPILDRREALLVPTTQPDSRTLINVGPPQSEQSLADAEVRFSSQGDLDANITIRLGAWRASQMRTTLSGIDGSRQDFLQQLAGRIFPGAANVAGEIRNERDLERPLEVSVHCRVPKFLDLSAASIDLDQLVPKLGLKKMYGSAASRRYPMYIDTPLVERTIFRVILPYGVRIAKRIPNTDVHSNFGRYTLSMRDLTTASYEITREFNIPVQVVAPAQYPDFADFAREIDDAERQRLIVSH